MGNTLKHAGSIVARRIQKYAEEWSAQHWHRDPFGQVPLASAQTYAALAQQAQAEIFPEIDAFERQMGFAVPQDWFHHLGLHTQVVIKKSNICYQHGRILYAALRAYLAGCADSSLTILETGTARGFSSTIMARALADAGRAGRVLTFDLLPHDVPMYWNCIDDHTGRKTRRALLAPWAAYTDPAVVYLEGDSRSTLSRVKVGRVHFAFLDGAHTYRDVMFEAGHIVPYQCPGDVIVFDDYSTGIFPGLVQAVDEICARYRYTKQVLSSKDQRAYVIATKQG